MRSVISKPKAPATTTVESPAQQCEQWSGQAKDPLFRIERLSLLTIGGCKIKKKPCSWPLQPRKVNCECYEMGLEDKMFALSPPTFPSVKRHLSQDKSTDRNCLSRRRGRLQIDRKKKKTARCAIQNFHWISTIRKKVSLHPGQVQ